MFLKARKKAKEYIEAIIVYDSRGHDNVDNAKLKKTIYFDKRQSKIEYA